MVISASTIWLISGAVLIAIEMTLLPGIGAVFAGLGAISVGIVLLPGWIESLTAQFILFFLATGFWTALLWRPLKKFMSGRESGFSDMVGSIAIVYEDKLEKGKIGQVRWSGTIMKCQLDSEAEGPEIVAPETEVIIAGVSKGILQVKTKIAGS